MNKEEIKKLHLEVHLSMREYYSFLETRVADGEREARLPFEQANKKFDAMIGAENTEIFEAKLSEALMPYNCGSGSSHNIDSQMPEMLGCNKLSEFLGLEIIEEMF